MKAETLAYIALWAVMAFLIGISVYQRNWATLITYALGYALGRYWRYLSEGDE